MMFKKVAQVVAVFSILALIATGCGGGETVAPADDGDDTAPTDGEPTNGDDDVDGPRAGGSMSFALDGDPVTLDPLFIRGAQGTLPEAQVAAAIFDVLIYEDTGTAEVVPHLAESIDTDDGQTWNLVLREGVRFHDGTNLDAEAVKFNWERALDTVSPLSGVVGTIESLTVVDPLTLRIELKSPNTQFHRSVAQQLAFIGSPAAIEERGEGFARNPVGAGPFKFVEWVPDVRIALERNDGYWNAPEPYLDAVEFRTIPDDTAQLNAIAAGELTATHTGNSGLVDMAEGLNLGIDVATTHGGVAFPLNTQRPPFDDVRARQAVSYAIDLDRHNQVVNDGKSTPTERLFIEGHALYADTRIHTYDPEHAQELFNELAAEQGGPLRIEVGCYEGLGNERMCQDIQSQLLEYDNVEASVDVADYVTANTRVVVERSFQVHLFGVNIIDPEPILYDYIHSEGRLNVTGYSNAEVDDLLERGRIALDIEERREIYARLAEIWAEETPQLLTFHQGVYRFFDPALKGLERFHTNMLWGSLWLDR